MRRIIFLLEISLMCMCSLAYAADYDLSNFTNASLIDGTYEGTHSFIKVSVTVKNGKIDEIIILEHGGGGKKYADMIEPLVDRIVEKQSTDVDAITGATVSSENLKKAIEIALKEAYKK